MEAVLAIVRDARWRRTTAGAPASLTPGTPRRIHGTRRRDSGRGVRAARACAESRGFAARARTLRRGTLPPPGVEVRLSPVRRAWARITADASATPVPSRAARTTLACSGGRSAVPSAVSDRTAARAAALVQQTDGGQSPAPARRKVVVAEPRRPVLNRFSAPMTCAAAAAAGRARREPCSHGLRRTPAIVRPRTGRCGDRPPVRRGPGRGPPGSAARTAPAAERTRRWRRPACRPPRWSSSIEPGGVGVRPVRRSARSGSAGSRRRRSPRPRCRPARRRPRQRSAGIIPLQHRVHAGHFTARRAGGAA